jgi:hypothetical protein
MELGELYHVGIVVPDLEEAAERLSGLLGVVWGPVVEATSTVVDLEGSSQEVEMKICYSTAAPYLELIEERPGTTWVCNEHSNLHHIGFFTERLGADSAGLSSASCPLDSARREEKGEIADWAYHRDPLGIRFELVDAAMRPMMEQYLFAPPGPEA